MVKTIRTSSSVKILKSPLTKVRKKIIKPGRKLKEKRGVVYLSHIPHGFYEEQIEAYFSQFGKVTAVSTPRSKAGRSRGFAFIEFRHPEVAEIAATTMNNYLMFNRLLKAKYIPPEQQKPHYFLAAKAAKENHKTAAENTALAVKHNRKLKNQRISAGLETKTAAKLLKKKQALTKRLEKLELSYDFEIEGGNITSIFERAKKMKEVTKKRLQEGKSDPNVQKGIETSDDQLSFLENSESQSVVDVDSSDEEEGEFNIISKAKNAAENILQKNTTSTKLTHTKSNKTPSYSLERLQRFKVSKKENIFQKKVPSAKENKPLTKKSQISKADTTGNKSIIPAVAMSSKLEYINRVETALNNISNRKLKHKTLKEHSVLRTSVSEKKIKPSRNENPKVEMKIDLNDDEEMFKEIANTSGKNSITPVSMSSKLEYINRVETALNNMSNRKLKPKTLKEHSVLRTSVSEKKIKPSRNENPKVVMKIDLNDDEEMFKEIANTSGKNSITPVSMSSKLEYINRVETALNNMSNRKLKPKTLKEHSVLRTSVSEKKIKPSVQPTRNENPNVVMGIDLSDDEDMFKVTPNVVQKFINHGDLVNKTPKKKEKPSLLSIKQTRAKQIPKGINGDDLVKTTPKEKKKTNIQLSPLTKKQSPAKKTPEGMKSAGRDSSATPIKSPGRKPRHRISKRFQ